MSFGSNICKTLIQNSARLLAANSASNVGRSFHILVKPMPKINIVENSAVTQQPFMANSIVSRLLAPVTSIFHQVAGFKVKGRLRRRCKDCYFVIRQQRHYVICPTHPRHKQMSMKKRPHQSWILTHATQSKVRPY